MSFEDNDVSENASVKDSAQTCTKLQDSAYEGLAKFNHPARTPGKEPNELVFTALDHDEDESGDSPSDGLERVGPEKPEPPLRDRRDDQLGRRPEAPPAKPIEKPTPVRTIHPDTITALPPTRMPALRDLIDRILGRNRNP